MGKPFGRLTAVMRCELYGHGQSGIVGLGGNRLSVRQVKSEMPGGSRGEIGAGSRSTDGRLVKSSR